MKISFLFIICLLWTVNLFSQNVSQIDTTFTIDSIWKNDTLFIIKTMHLSVIIRDSLTNEHFENDSASSFKNKKILEPQNPISYSFLSPSSPVLKNNYSKNTIFLIPFFKFYYSKSFYSPQNTYINQSIKSIGSFQLGMNIQKEQKSLDYIFGINLSLFVDKFSFTQKWTETSVSYSEYFKDNSFWQVDTIWILNTDSLLNGDTVYFSYFDSSYIKHIDTLQIENKKTNTNSKETNKYNSLVILNFPFSIGKHFDFENYSLFLSTGLLTSIFLNKKYQIPSATENSFLPVIFPKIYFSLLANCRFEYEISKQTYFWYGFNLNFPLNNFLKIGDISKRNYQIGISCGLKIRI